MSHPFDSDTSVEALANGSFRTTITDRWTGFGGRLGGYLIALCLRALSQTMVLPDPLVFSAYFLRPGQVGTAEVQTETVRSGRRTGTGEARLVQGGKEAVRMVATFSDLRQANGSTATFTRPPQLPGPDEAVDPLADVPHGGLTIGERIDLRGACKPGWLRGEPSGDPAGAYWIRLAGGRDADLLSLALLVDALPLAIFELGTMSTTLELTAHLRGHPAPGWLLARNRTRHVRGGFHEEDVEIWDANRSIVAQARQLALLAGPS